VGLLCKTADVCFVYLLLCRDGDGPIYIKVGITGAPKKRLLALRAGCPVEPRYFYSAQTRSRDWARKVERDQHTAFARWRTQGEWFSLKMEDKQEFNALLRSVAERHSDVGCKIEFDKLVVKPYVAHLHQKAKFAQVLHQRRGKAFQDFAKHASAS